MEEKTDKLDSTNISNFCSVKDTVKIKKKRQATDWEKIVVKHISDKGLVSKIDKEFLKPNNLKNLTKHGQSIWADTSPKNTYRWQISL